MTISHYVLTNNPVLRQVAMAISPENIANRKTQELIDFMINIGKKEPHMAGLAAPQVGFPFQIIIVSDRAFVPDRPVPDTTKENSFKVFINPEITYATHEEEEDVEGCFSVPGDMGIVPRVKSITVKAYDENGSKVNLKVVGFTARVFQHEIDHLNGIIYPDRIFRFHSESLKFHFLFKGNESSEHQLERIREYQELIKDWKMKHGNLDGFIWSGTISKNKWETKIVQSTPDWNNAPLLPFRGE